MNPVNALSCRFDYDGASPLNTKLLPILQNKLALWINSESAQSKELVAAINPVFCIAGIQVVIPRKDVRDVPETAYKEPRRPMKTLI